MAFGTADENHFETSRSKYDHVPGGLGRQVSLFKPVITHRRSILKILLLDRCTL